MHKEPMGKRERNTAGFPAGNGGFLSQKKGRLAAYLRRFVD